MVITYARTAARVGSAGVGVDVRTETIVIVVVVSPPASDRPNRGGEKDEKIDMAE